MNYGLYLSAAGLKAQMDRQSVITNNIANAQTTGFKRDLVIMQSRRNAAYEDPRLFPYRLPVVSDQGGGVYAQGDGIDLTQSTFEETSNQTDVALNGPGFLTVAGDHPGEKLLTRDGRFMLDQEGQLVTTASHRAVLDNSGQPITLDASLPVAIARDGTLSQAGQGSGAKLGLADVSDSRQLVKLGGNVLRSTGDLTEINPETQVLQFKLENSGVEPMVEIVKMMEGQRAFDANARMMSFQDTTMSQLNTVGRIA